MRRHHVFSHVSIATKRLLSSAIPMGPPVGAELVSSDSLNPEVDNDLHDFYSKGFPPNLSPEAHQAARDALIGQLLSLDKEVFELKRQHELSMLRVEQNQTRILKDQEDRGMYYEQNCNVHTFDTISVNLHSQRSTVHHTILIERLRNLKTILSLLLTMCFCAYIYYRYMVNDDWSYVPDSIKLHGSRVHAVREAKWKEMSDEERDQYMKKQQEEYQRNRDIQNATR